MDIHKFIAHIDAEGNTQSMEDHASGVAELCSKFCTQINPDWHNVGVILGLLHDHGKYQEAFQNYIRYSAGLIPHGPGRAPNSMAGAIYAQKIGKSENEALSRIFAYCIGGHHRGLYDSCELEKALRSADNKAYYTRMLCDAPEAAKAVENRLMKFLPLPDIMEIDDPDRPLFIRMLFSALVDADYLDAEAFMDRVKFELRTKAKQTKVLWEVLRDKLKAKTDCFNHETTINRTRSYFLDRCRKHGAGHDPDIYSLFLPTGGGKTLSSMTWALESAIRNNASRIIYVIPYTSIITQTAEIFKDIFGEEYILEHHSEFDVNDEELYNKSKLLSENWDAPIVITTNVQMFESLYSHRTSRCRKLHNICNAVIVFDEVQMFPTGYLNPMLRAIESLSLCFGAGILLCTATQPVFSQTFEENRKRSGHFYCIDDIEEIVPYDAELFGTFDRVRYHTPVAKYTTTQLAEELHKHSSALCIVNTRADAGAIYDAVVALGRDSAEVVHLSRMMCSLHIRKQIAYIKARLSAGLPTITISTQLIEAGVDIDFPIVYRAHTGLDSIIQAGGRCNREGKLPHGDVYIFDLSDGSSPWGETKLAQQASNLIYRKIENNSLNPNNPQTICQYYMEYYGNQVNSFDKAKIEDLLWSHQAENDLELDFETASDKFRLIDDRDITDIYVPYGKEGEAIIEKVCRCTFISRQEFRTLQKLRIGIRKQDFEALRSQGVLKETKIGELVIWVLAYGDQCYDDARGLRCNDIWTNEILTT